MGRAKKYIKNLSWEFIDKFWNFPCVCVCGWMRQKGNKKFSLLIVKFEVELKTDIFTNFLYHSKAIWKKKGKKVFNLIVPSFRYYNTMDVRCLKNGSTFWGFCGFSLSISGGNNIQLLLHVLKQDKLKKNYLILLKRVQHSSHEFSFSFLRFCANQTPTPPAYCPPTNNPQNSINFCLHISIYYKFYISHG